MPHVSPTDPSNTHDFMLSDGTNTYGFQYARSPFEGYQESLLSGGSKIFKVEQKTFTSGRGKIDFVQDPNGYTDSMNAWTMTDGAVYPTLQWNFAKGLRNADFWLPGPMSFQALTGSQLYVSQSFTTTGGYVAAHSYFWIRKVGSPGTLTVEWCSDSSGSPGTVRATATLAAANLRDTTTYFNRFTPTAYTLAATTLYHLKAYGAATDNATNHWEIGVGTGSNAKQSAAGSSWSTAAFTLYYRITDADVKRKWHHFYMQGSDFIVSANDDNGAPLIYINGDRGLATSGSAYTIVCSGKSWSTDAWVGAKVRIVDGKGDGQIRAIMDSNGTTLSVAAWDVAPDSTSVFVIYDTDTWTLVTLHGLTIAPTGPPLTGGAGGGVYIPQGKAVDMRVINYVAGEYVFAADTGNRCDLLGLTVNSAGAQQIAAFSSGTAEVAVALAGYWPLTFAADKSIGASDYKVTGTINYDGYLHAFKENGLFKIVNGIAQEVNCGGLASAPDLSNGAYPCVQNLWLYFTRANSVVQMQGENATDIENFRIGYEQLPLTRRGPGTLLSAEGWIFRTIDAGTGESSALVWNGYGWHEILRGYEGTYNDGARIRGAFWQPCPGTLSRLWTDIAGDLVYQRFPQYGSNPLKDSNCRFQHECVLVTPTLDINDKNFYKFFKDVQATSKNLSATSTIAVDYQLDDDVGTDIWIVLTQKSTVFDTSPFYAVDIEQGGVFQIRLRFRFLSASNTIPPILNSWTVNGSVIEPQKYQWSMTCAVESDGEDLQGGADTDPDTLDSWLKDMAARRVRLTVSSQKTSLHGKVVCVEALTVRMSSIDTEEGSSKWVGTLWFNLREQ